MKYTVLLFLLTFHVFAYAENTLKVGMLVCLTGECAADGRGATAGADIAVAEINEQGGIFGRNVQLVVEDTAEAIQAARVVSAYHKFIAGKEIRYLIGPSWTPGGLALAQLAKHDDVIITSPSLGAKEFHTAGDNIFNLRGTDEASTRAAAKLAMRLGYNRVAIFSSEQPWERSQATFFEDEFRREGGIISTKIEPLPTITNLSTEALRLVASKPDAIFFSSVVQLPLIVKELKKLHYNGTKIAAFVDETRIKESNGLLEGVMHYGSALPREHFAKKYIAMYRHAPEIPAAAAYDTMYAYKAAIEAAQSFDPALVKKEMLRIDFAGASGQVRLDSEGCIVKEPKLFVVREGESRPVESY